MKAAHNGSRVVITGMGAVTPAGLSVADFWDSITAGRSGVGPVTLFDAEGYPARIAGEVKGFDPLDFMGSREAKRMARFGQFALASVRMALKDGGLDMEQEDGTRVGLEIGSAVGGMEIVEEQVLVLAQRGPRRVQPTALSSMLVNMAPCQIAIELGIKGPVSAPVAACATGVVAVGEATRRLQRGDVEVMIAGGAESMMTPLAIVAFSRIGALSTRNDEPERACRPFDADRDGTVMSEGAAVLVLETLEHAAKRGARIYAQVLGYGFTEDAYHIAAPDPSGDGAAWAMSLAIQEAGINPSEVDYIASHGTGTVLNDVSETKAIKAIFGGDAYRVPISSNKSMVGHMLGAAGSISIIATVKAMEDSLLPPTINLETPDPECDLDYVPHLVRPARVDVGLINAFGFGG
ncbi:MAG TPA: beta-ketoacyl-[acyl-carrier-protein] synthase II, partial [Chloroflexi bacterium]|nr:beta-ketoacyl-[acyl-carrier-protein] synthase II [Chloroflexota bacterium]